MQNNPDFLEFTEVIKSDIALTTDERKYQRRQWQHEQISERIAENYGIPRKFVNRCQKYWQKRKENMETNIWSYWCHIF